ncbi:DNA-binding response regulator [Nakamurella antarctica]|uniref:DNA-binding response regulator n=1 Tax=Nakamurella antarctica TaxID=1902245 RepID=A0A3G8ZRZ1_9ACTN|nr:response regulator transcription factor [Nakamurella antarctica]AZI59565.1 DNA-binding response regulator [Nakamurella antarctica]
MTVLLAEDDPDISEPLARALEREGYAVLLAKDGQSALDQALEGDISLVILDLGLPIWDGLDVCRRIRQAGKSTPVLMLTARTDEADFVVGLDAGADDYVAKPFRTGELLARVRALLRRRSPEILECSGIRMDLGARQVTVDGAPVGLANKEFELLRILMAHAGDVVTREQVLEEVWADPAMKNSKTLDMHMSWLRRKISPADSEDTAEKPEIEHRITTIRGLGFRFNVI